MTNPTPEQITQAYKNLSELCEYLDMGWRMTQADIAISKRAILDVLPPIPEPTMADIEWDNDQHFLAEARTNRRSVIMLSKVYQEEDGDHIRCISKDTNDNVTLHIYPASSLTPTGHRYTLN